MYQTRTWGHDKAVEVSELCELLLLELLGIFALHLQTRRVGDNALGVVDDCEGELTLGVEAVLDNGAGPGHVVDGVVVNAGGSDWCQAEQGIIDCGVVDEAVLGGGEVLLGLGHRLVVGEQESGDICGQKGLVGQTGLVMLFQRW